MRAIDIIKHKIKEGGTCVDVGASFGEITTELLNAVGDNGKVYAFEPSMGSYYELLKIASLRDNLRVYNSAVGESNKVSIILQDPASLSERYNHSYGNGVNPREVRCVNIDSLDIGYIDFIVIDCQGSEYEVFKGMKNLINTQVNIKILSAFWNIGITECGNGRYTGKDYLQDLRDNEFKIYEIDKYLGKMEEIGDLDRFVLRYPLKKKRQNNLVFIYAER